MESNAVSPITVCSNETEQAQQKEGHRRGSGKQSIYEQVTDRILKQLAAGTVPWRKTWVSGLPKSLTTGKEYRGVNILLLGCAAYTSRYWVTFRETRRLGGHVRKGERATPVVYWQWRTDEENQKLREKTGKQDIAPCVPFVSAVFNFEQVEGLTRPDDDVPQHRNNALEVADQVYEIMPDKPEIQHSAISQPAYLPRCDRVTLPHLSQFESAAEYYASLFHELVHSTGHVRRLGRFAEAEGDRIEKYSFEELVAEFGAAFLCGFAGIQNPETDALQAGYIQGWMTAFKNDTRLAIRAASAAQRAVDYIRGKVSPEATI